MQLALSLSNIPLELQITICFFLHPSDILALRKTCRALEHTTRQRIVWVTVFNQVCLDNALFLPSFPIIDMSNLELERAAMGPRRWIDLCVRGALPNEDPTFSGMLHLRKIIGTEDDDKIRFFIVPGGRYLVTAATRLSVWDLGYVSTADCKLVASVKVEDYCSHLMVQATPDGKGLVILFSYLHKSDTLSIFEMYPQSEIPLITQIARFVTDLGLHLAYFSPDTLVFRGSIENGIGFRVVDYRTNYSTHFSATLCYDEFKFNLKPDFKNIYATKTAIFVLCQDGILIWAIPPLSPQPSNSIDILPLKIPFPDGSAPHDLKISNWMTVNPWYLKSLEAFYFDVLYTSRNLELQRFKIIIKPDLSDSSIHVMNMPEVISHHNSIPLASADGHFRICDGALVYFWNNSAWNMYTGFTSAPFTNVFSRWTFGLGPVNRAQVGSYCPASGRYVYYRLSGNIVVVDLLL